MLQKMNEVCFHVSAVLEDMEPKLDYCFQVLKIKFSLVQDTPLEVALASSLALASKPVMPKEDKGFLGQLEDPSGMLFTRVSLGYEVKLDTRDMLSGWSICT